MPPLTRRMAVGASLAVGGTLVGALAARKLLAGPAAGVADPAGMPPLQSLAGLHLVSPPASLPPFTWQAFSRHAVAAEATPRSRSIGDHAGQGIVLNIWATWCDPCTREMPSLARLAAAVGPGIAVLPVSIDRGGAASIRAFYAAQAIEDLPVLADTQSRAMSALGLAGIPTTFLIGRDGRLRARCEGAADWSTPDAVASVGRITLSEG